MCVAQCSEVETLCQKLLVVGPQDTTFEIISSALSPLIAKQEVRKATTWREAEGILARDRIAMVIIDLISLDPGERQAVAIRFSEHGIKGIHIFMYDALHGVGSPNILWPEDVFVLYSLNDMYLRSVFQLLLKASA